VDLESWCIRVFGIDLEDTADDILSSSEWAHRRGVKVAYDERGLERLQQYSGIRQPGSWILSDLELARYCTLLQPKSPTEPLPKRASPSLSLSVSALPDALIIE
jgi:hypothetical protein